MKPMLVTNTSYFQSVFFNLLGSQVQNLVTEIGTRCIPYTKETQDLASLKTRISNSAAYTLNEQEITQIKSALIHSKSWFGGKLLQELVQIPLNAIEQAIAKGIETDKDTTLLAYLDQFLATLNDQQLLKECDPELVDLTIEKETLLKESTLKSILQVKGKAVWREIRYEVYHFCHHLIDIFISLIGYQEIGRKRKISYESASISSYEAKAKLDLYLTLFGYPSVVYAALYSMVKSAPVAGLASAVVIFSTILFIPIYTRFLKPCPKSHSGLENITENILREKVDPTYHRMNILTQILDAFKSGKGVLFIAKPGVGKTTLINSLGELIVDRQTNGLLDNAQLFSVNGNQIKAAAMGLDTLSCNLLSEFFADHKKEVIFFIDEIDSMFKENALDGGKPSKSLLTFVDKFRYTIGATTEQEYDKYIKDDEEAFHRRFNVINLNEMLNHELMQALYVALNFKAPELKVDTDTMMHIIQKANVFAPRTSQVDAAQSLLSSGISKVTSLSFPTLEEEIHSLSNQVESLETTLIHNDGSLFTKDEYQKKIDEFKEKKQKLKEKKAELEHKQKMLQKLRAIEACAAKLDQKSYVLAENAGSNPLAKRKWMLNKVKHKILMNSIAATRRELGLPERLDKAVIDEIIAKKQN